MMAASYCCNLNIQDGGIQSCTQTVKRSSSTSWHGRSERNKPMMLRLTHTVAIIALLGVVIDATTTPATNLTSPSSTATTPSSTAITGKSKCGDTCKHFSVCNEKTSECHCPSSFQINSNTYSCGSDGRTYKNVEELMLKACNAQTNLNEAYRGPCLSTTTESPQNTPEESLSAKTIVIIVIGVILLIVIVVVVVVLIRKKQLAEEEAVVEAEKSGTSLMENKV